MNDTGPADTAGAERAEIERLRAALEQRSRELEALAEINRAIAQPPDDAAPSTRAAMRPEVLADAELPGALLERIVNEGGKLVRADGAGITLVRGDHAQDLEVGPAYGPLSSVPGRRLPLRGSITGRVVRTGTAELIPDVTRDPDWFPLADPAPPGSAMVVPLRAGSTTLGGLVVVRGAAQPTFGIEERDVLQRFADQAAIAIQQRLLVRQLEEENRRKEEFVSTLSHELRTPLAGILLWNDILRSDPAAKQLGASAEAFPVITQSAEMLLAMMNDLLDLGRIEAGKLRLERRPADVTVIARQALVAFPRNEQQTGLVLDDLLGSLPPVYVDPVRIQQIISNLLSNAVKFTDPPGQITMRGQVTSDGEAVAVSVEDTGPGIAPEVIPHIFERFRQGETTPARRRAGLGIGLTLARALVEAHGGLIRVDSVLGQGSTFTFQVPVATDVDLGSSSVVPASAGGAPEAGPWVAAGDGSPDQTGADAGWPYVARADAGAGGAGADAGMPEAAAVDAGGPEGGVANAAGSEGAEAGAGAAEGAGADAGMPETAEVDAGGPEGAVANAAGSEGAETDAGAPDRAVAKAAQAEGAEVDAGAAEDSGADAAAPMATVLIAEDVAKTRRALLTVLSARGYRVLEAADGEEATRIARAERPDVVLMDVAMPKLDGLSALAFLRQDPVTAAIPVAAVTARAMPDDRRRIDAAGFDAHLVKPFRIAELVETLGQLLTVRR